MPYLQLTQKCNMSCAHCCYSCGPRGKHGEYGTLLSSMDFILERDTIISLGGGEPTLHPRFFDLLKYALARFDYVWFATNGSQTEKMMRIANILDGCDYESFDYSCTCKTDEERNNCSCPGPVDFIQAEGKLSVALSLDPFHDPIDPRVEHKWRQRASVREFRYEIRDTSNHLSNMGRAKKNQLAVTEDCCCEDLFILPDGRIKLCGCTRSPVIGHIRGGIEERWQDIIDNDEEYTNTGCYKSLRKGKRA